jgi:hypothetical protein
VERGRVLHPRGFGIEEMQWRSAAEILSRRSSAGCAADEDVSMEDEEGLEDALGNKAEVCASGPGGACPKTDDQLVGTTRNFAKLSFIPNCLTAR